MPAFWQIVQARAVQTQGVWTLAPSFTVRDDTKTTHAANNSALTEAVGVMDTAELDADGAFASLAADRAWLRDINKRALARFESELPEDHPLRSELDTLGGIRQDTPADIERRTEKTVALWTRLNALRGAQTPPAGALLIHNTPASDVDEL